MSEPSTAAARPLWLLLAPAIFLILWSGGYSIAKLGIRHAEPMTFLALRYAVVLVILAPFAIVMKPAWPTRPAQWFHIAFVGFLIQGVYFGLAKIKGPVAPSGHGGPFVGTGLLFRQFHG